MPWGFSQATSQLAVLESKFEMYEDLSKEMLERLEKAVDKISESNSQIATILAKHDERIDQGLKTNDLMLKLIEELKTENKEDHIRVRDKINRVEIRIDELVKFRWITVGVATTAAVIISASGLFADLLTPDHPRAIIEEKIDFFK
jgi:putative NIF3 family GTP cyclohydrolase 1 type 2